MPLAEIETRWAILKNMLSAESGLSHWQLHTIIGLAVFAGTALFAPRRWPSWWLLAPITFLEVLNEVSDVTLFYSAGAGRYWQPSDALIEMILTLAPSAAILILARSGRRPGKKNPQL